jgi:hypothetical protein
MIVIPWEKITTSEEAKRNAHNATTGMNSTFRVSPMMANFPS